MTEKYIHELETLINFGISSRECLSKEERQLIIREFRKNFKFSNYSQLFKELDIYLKEDIPNEEKGKVVKLLMEFICSFPTLEENVSSLPIDLLNLYNSYMSLHHILILFEQIESYEFPLENEFSKILLKYLDFLDNPGNIPYILYSQDEIDKLNNKFISYLNKEDYNGLLFKESLNKELVNKVEELKSMVNKK